jgi:hypothetical protein
MYAKTSGECKHRCSFWRLSGSAFVRSTPNRPPRGRLCLVVSRAQNHAAIARIDGGTVFARISTDEPLHRRLVAFVLIIYAIVDKNRVRKS